MATKKTKRTTDSIGTVSVMASNAGGSERVSRAPKLGKGCFRVIRGYFYRPSGLSAEQWAERMVAKMNELYGGWAKVELLDSGDHWHAFVGGAKPGSACDSFYYAFIRVTAYDPTAVDCTLNCQCDGKGSGQYHLPGCPLYREPAHKEPTATEPSLCIATFPCQKCGAPTFLPDVVPVGTNLQSSGLTMGNARRYVKMDGHTWILCANCRYDEPFCRY